MSQAEESFKSRIEVCKQGAILPANYWYQLVTAKPGQRSDFSLFFKCLGWCSTPVLLPATLITLPIGVVSSLGVGGWYIKDKLVESFSEKDDKQHNFIIDKTSGKPKPTISINERNTAYSQENKYEQFTLLNHLSKQGGGKPEETPVKEQANQRLAS